MKALKATLFVLVFQAVMLGDVAPSGGLVASPQAVVGAALPLRGGRFEASGAAQVPGAPGILFVDDDRTREVMWLPFDPLDHAGPPQALRMAADVTDPEGMTFDGRHHYLVGSQSKRTGSRGDGLVRFLFDWRTRGITQVETIKGLRAFLGTRVAQLKGVERQTGDRSLNIEAIAWDPIANRWLLGLRAPLIDGRALVVPLELADPAGGFTADNLRVPNGRAIEVPLGGAGIRSLEYDATLAAFRVITGASLNEESLQFRLYVWQGTEGKKPPVLEHVFPADAKPEGITTTRINDMNRTVVVYDGSSYRFLR